MKNFVTVLSIIALTGFFFVGSPSFAAEKEGTTLKGATIYSYDTTTDAKEVAATILKVIKNKGRVKIIVITGTHGASNGTVDKSFAEVNFKMEDFGTANVSSNLITIRDYHQTAPNRWKEISDSGNKVVIVLAWCYSNQWLSNKTAQGNKNLIAMK
ncbi:MAG: hypothetical protein HQM08_09590 [Candidatus Riflebacteria bacterium]|nr:hypothetical protein [Candidatus Riflebacteria bacterium]